MRIRQRQPDDHDIVASFLAERHSHRVARRGELCHPLDHPALLAIGDGGELRGVLTFILDDTLCEILTLHTTARWQGTGTALITAIRQLATDAGCHRLRLTTTNDNVDALRFYQRRGFRLTALLPGAVDESRATLKPEIPATGDYGIPLRDELELELLLPLMG